MMDSARILTIHIEEPKKKRDEEGEGEKEDFMVIRNYLFWNRFVYDLLVIYARKFFEKMLSFYLKIFFFFVMKIGLT